MFLRKEQREALKHVYEFCRVVDDVVDERLPGIEGEAQARATLRQWSDEIDRVFTDPPRRDHAPKTELGNALRTAHELFDFPRHAFDEILAGVEMDLTHSTYQSLDDLKTYCYRVASCVGFLCIAVFGDQGEHARKYAEHLGLALQYTNILRDVAEDAARGRVYLPLDLLREHGLDTQDILRQRYDVRFVALAQAFAEMAEREYRLAWESHPHANARALLPAEIMGRTYHRILEEIRARNYNVFTRRAGLRRRDKLKVAARAIARTSLGSYF
jgi:phytoene synthase